MSRPKDLPSALQAWALANYAGGPVWGGTAQRQAPAGATLTPGVSMPAENANYLWGYGFDAAQGAINAGGQLPALNWGAAQTIASTGANVAYNEAETAWYACLTGAVSTTIYRSQDVGKSWTAVTIPSNTTQFDVAFDAAGNGVIAGTTAVTSGAYNSYGSITWTNNAAVLAGLGPAQVVYEPTSALWAIIGDIAATGIRLYTSANRTAWTLQTIPATWSTSTLTASPQIGAGNGILVACFTDTGGTAFRTMRSANGGVTWTNDQSVAIGFTVAGSSTSLSRPTYSTADGLWYIAANALATRKTQVYSSPDGITWTTRVTLSANDMAIRCLVAIGSLLIGLNDDGRVFASWTQGATWFRCGNCGVAVPVAMKLGGGGVMAFGSSTSLAPSSRFGLPTVSV